ncbi:MAG: hypothetical protein RI560_12560, partial [Natronomonas sp.]|nr:hypothetical protein [Natronomonas sp.]
MWNTIIQHPIDSIGCARGRRGLVRATIYDPAQRTSVSDQFDGGGLAPDDIDDTPTVACSQCDEE